MLPPGCVELEKGAGVPTLQPSEITLTVMARTEANEPGRRINASIGLARPSDISMYAATSRSITDLAKTRRRAATMRKTSRPLCWRQRPG
jgi:pyruvoyl-dependent arginine decarboxylase (PvlArgDC)